MQKSGGCYTSGVSARMPWYTGHCCGTWEMKKNLISAHCLFGMCWQWQSWQGHHSPCLTGRGRKWRGWTSFVTYCWQECGASTYFWLYADIQGCGELPMYTSVADWFRAYAFCAIFSLIGSWLGLVAVKTIQVIIVMSCRYLCFYSILAAQPIGTWKQKCFWNKTHYTFSPAQFPDHRLSISFIFSMLSMSITFLVYCSFSQKKSWH